MTDRAQRIEREIQDLPLEDMLVLHEHLVALIQEKEEQLDPTYRAETQRRIEEIESGTAVGVDAFEALRRM